MKVRVAGGRIFLNSDTVYGVSTSAAVVIATNVNRHSAILQNVGTEKIYVRFGAAPVLSGTKKFSAILAPASGAEEGDGGSLTIEHFDGDVYVSTSSGTSTLIATEFKR